MKLTLKRFRAACALEGQTVDEYARRAGKSRRAIYRAIKDPDFSRPLREKLLTYTNRILNREGLAIRRAA